MEAVATRLNQTYAKFCSRNPTFKGNVSLAGHSLGSLIIFDLLQNQKPPSPDEVENSETPDEPIVKPMRKHPPLQRICSQQINYNVGKAGTGQPFVTYPQLKFQPKKFFAMGSPIGKPNTIHENARNGRREPIHYTICTTINETIHFSGMFVTVRGVDALGLNFKLPTTENFFNIFHPYDPVAYRIEALVNPELSTLRPVLVPHHKGRKRMHLELRETMARVGADLKQRIVSTFRSTLNTVYSFATVQTKAVDDQKAIEQEVEKVLNAFPTIPTEPAFNKSISLYISGTRIGIPWSRRITCRGEYVQCQCVEHIQRNRCQ